MKNAFYFQHDSNSRNDENLLELRVEFGAEGYGIFWMILETMSETEDGELCLSKIGGLSLGYGVAKDTLKAIIDFCIKSGLFIASDTHYWSKRMKEHLEVRQALSDAGKRGAKKRWANSGKDSLPNGGANAKGKERKEKERKEKDITNGLDNLLPSIEFQEFFKSYPKRECLTDAQETWNVVVRNDPDIIEKIKMAVKWQKKTGCLKEVQYAPKAHVWLQGKRWLDENTVTTGVRRRCM